MNTIHFTMEEQMLLELFPHENLHDQLQALSELIPLTKDDSEITDLLTSTITKLETFSDSDYQSFERSSHYFEEDPE